MAGDRARGDGRESETGGGSKRAPAGELGTWPGKLKTGARWGKDQQGTVWVRVAGRWTLVCVTGARRGCENSLFHRSYAGLGGGAVRGEDGASRRVETGRVSGTL